MKPKTALVLGLFLAACVVFVLVKNTSLFQRETAVDSNRSDRVLPAADSSRIRKVAILPRQGPKIVLERAGEDWRLEEPLRAKANGSEVTPLLRTLCQLKYASSFAPGDKDAVEPNLTGLDSPLWTVELVDAAGATFRLAVGKPPALRRGETYVHPEGDPRTYVAKADLAETLARPAREYRDKVVLKFNAADVVGLELSGLEVGGAYELEKRKDGWGILRPFSARAEEGAVRDILSSLSYVSAIDFVEEAPASLVGYGLEEGKERLVVRVSVQAEPDAPPAPASASAPAASGPASRPAPKVLAIAFGTAREEKAFARVLGEPAVFQVGAPLVAGLQQKLQSLRRSTVLDFDTMNVSAIGLEMPDGNALLRKQDGQWMMDKPVSGKASGKAVWDLLGRLANLKAASWPEPGTVPPAVTGLEKPYARITLTQAGTDQTTALLVGSASGTGETYVRTAGGTSIALVKSADVLGLLASGATYWDTAIFSLPADLTATRLAIARRDNSYTLLRGEDNAWRLTSPIEANADSVRVRKVLADLSPLSAEKIVYLGAEVPDKYAKAAHNITVEVFGHRPATQPFSAPSTQPASEPSTQLAPVTSPGRPATASAPVTRPAASLPTRPAAAAPAGASRPSRPASMPAGDSTQPATATASQPATATASRPATGPAATDVSAGRIQFAKVDDKAYAWVPGQKMIAVGEFPAAVYDDLAAEFRDRRIWTLDANDVQGLRVIAETDRVDLRREGEDWVNAIDPAEKMDGEKVRAYLGDLKGLTVERFMTYKTTDADSDKLGLKKPWLTVELRMGKAGPLTLVIGPRGQAGADNKYASGGLVDGIFLLPAETAGKLARKLAHFRKEAARPYPNGVE